MSTRSQPPKLYQSAAHACPYIRAQTASTVMLDPRYPMDNTLFSILLKSGFRRSGKTIYRPHCRACNACISVRIPAREYRPNRAQRRTYRKNNDIHTTMKPATFNDEHFALYCRYQAARHSDDPMDHSNPKSYREFLLESSVESVFIEHRLNKKLVAISISDLSDDGLSAVYTFFDPTLKTRSLGTHAIMKQIDYVNTMDLDWLYIGYWIAGCQKMAYKKNFTPLFGYVNQEWKLL